MKTNFLIVRSEKAEGRGGALRAARLALGAWQFVLVALLLARCACAQVTVDNVLTNGLFEPYGVAVDGDNIVYVTDSSNHRIVRFDPNTGVAATLAGVLGGSGNSDGPSYLAHLNSPEGIALATVGGVSGLVVGDTGNHTIRFVNLTNGSIITLAGKAGIAGGTADAVGT